MYNDLLNQLIINKIQGHKTFISINIASDFIIAFIIIFKNKLSYTRNHQINTGKMITTLLALLFIVKPSGRLTQCLLYKALHLATKNKLVSNLKYFSKKIFFIKYNNKGLFSYAKLGFYKTNITSFFSVLLSNFNYQHSYPDIEADHLAKICHCLCKSH